MQLQEAQRGLPKSYELGEKKRVIFHGNKGQFVKHAIGYRCRNGDSGAQQDEVGATSR